MQCSPGKSACAAFAALSGALQQGQKHTGGAMMKNSALVVIDLQNDITKNYREIIGRVNEAIDWAAREEL